MNDEYNRSGTAGSGANTSEDCIPSREELLGHLTEARKGWQAAEDKIQKLEQKLVERTQELTASDLALQQNIEALKQSKHRLREREAKLNSIFNAAVEGIVTIERSGTVVTANTALKAILGYTEEELVGRNISMLMPPFHAEKHDRYIQNYISTGISRIIGSVREVEGLHKGGWTVPLDLSLAEFVIDGEIYFTGILRDVTQRKRQERENREHLEELAHVARLSLMGEMASGIAHEVNQPLTAIAAYTRVSLTLLKSQTPDLAKLVDILEKTHQQALRAGQIIHRMRDFIRSKTSNRTSANVNQLVRDCIGLCATDIKLLNIVFSMELADQLPRVFVNEVQIEQVLMNLVRNGIEAMQDVPPEQPRRLQVKTRLDDRHFIEISVEDSGPGISDAERRKIMTPFFTTKKNGMGMGLSISRSLVEAHHGTLRFDSRTGEGCTFYVTLPTKRPI